MTDDVRPPTEVGLQFGAQDLIALEHQSLLEIVMAVGNGMDRRAMLQSSLSVMMRKLGCNIGAVVRCVDDEMTVVHGIPYHVKSSAEVMSICQLAMPASSNPLMVETPGRTVMAFKLPRYGMLVLGRSGEPLARRVQGKMTQIAEKLATACISCEQALEIRQSQFATEQALATLDATRDAALVADPTTLRFTYVNQGAVHQLGYSRAELLEMTPMDINPDLDEPQLRELFNTFLRGERVFMHFTANHRRKDGTEVPVEINLQLLELEPGKPRFIASARDITERKQAEDGMHQALATLDATADGAFIFDPDTLAFTYVNQGATRQLGYARDELLALTALDITPDLDESKFRASLAPLLSGSKSVLHYTTRHRCKDGRALPMEVSLQLVTIPAGQRRFIAIARDITERLDHERQERRAQRIESIGTLAGGVAHDLNNALAPILMTCEMIRADLPATPVMIDMIDMIETIEASAQRGADMVRQLLTFAKGVEGERRVIQPIALFVEMHKIIVSTFPKHVQLRTSYAPDLRPLLGDYTQLHQVLLNLCVNARDAMPNGGTLTLEAENVEIDAGYAARTPDGQSGPHLVWRVSDTGCGIPPDLLDRIFEPFFSTKGQDGGTGLGLSTVSGIVRSHGGFIRVASTVGRGTTFSVHLPAASRIAATLELTPTAEPQFRGNGETILVVDDEPAVLRVTRALLTRLNFQVLTAADGTEALIKVAERRSDLIAVVTDLHMPHMDGLTLVRALRRMLPGLGIIVTSGRLDMADALSFKALGVAAIIDKPCTKAQLLTALVGIVHK